MLAGATKLATVVSAESSLSNMLKLATRLRGRGLASLQSVYNLLGAGEPPVTNATTGGSTSMLEACGFAAAPASRGAPVRPVGVACHLDELIGLNYDVGWPSPPL